MSLVATTITEHYYNEGLIVGRIKGREEGRKVGKKVGIIKGEIKSLEKLYQFGVLTEAQYNQFMKPLKEQLQRLQASGEGQNV